MTKPPVEGKSLKHRLEVIMAPGDEARLLTELRLTVPEVALVVDQIWDTPEPPIVDSFAATSCDLLYLWDRRSVPRLMATPTADGRYRGPYAGVVIQLERSVLLGDRLLAGSVSAGWSGPALQPFVEAVWRVLRQITEGDVVTLAGERTPYRAGSAAIEWLTAGPSRFFGASNSSVLLAPRRIWRGWRSEDSRRDPAH